MSSHTPRYMLNCSATASYDEDLQTEHTPSSCDGQLTESTGCAHDHRLSCSMPVMDESAKAAIMRGKLNIRSHRTHASAPVLLEAVSMSMRECVPVADNSSDTGRSIKRVADTSHVPRQLSYHTCSLPSVYPARGDNSTLAAASDSSILSKASRRASTASQNTSFDVGHGSSPDPESASRRLSQVTVEGPFTCMHEGNSSLSLSPVERKSSRLLAVSPLSRSPMNVDAGGCDEQSVMAWHSSSDASDVLVECNSEYSECSSSSKRKSFLERNRQAALKCRQRKKAWLASLQARVDFLESENNSLRTTVEALRSEVVFLKSQLIQTHAMGTTMSDTAPNESLPSLSRSSMSTAAHYGSVHLEPSPEFGDSTPAATSSSSPSSMATTLLPPNPLVVYATDPNFSPRVLSSQAVTHGAGIASITHPMDGYDARDMHRFDQLGPNGAMTSSYAASTPYLASRTFY